MSGIIQEEICKDSKWFFQLKTYRVQLICLITRELVSFKKIESGGGLAIIVEFNILE